MTQNYTLDGVQLYKYANKTTAFVVETALGIPGKKEGYYQDKLVFVLIQRDAENRATKTVKFWMDLPAALHLFTAIKANALKDPWTEFKKTDTAERKIKIAVDPEKNEIKFEINESSGEDRKYLFMSLPKRDAVTMSLWILKLIDIYLEQTKMAQFQEAHNAISALKKKTTNKPYRSTQRDDFDPPPQDDLPEIDTL